MYNKSVCLDLESYLVKMMAGDGANRVLKRNNGITGKNYYQCERYRDGFPYIFAQLKGEGLFTRTSRVCLRLGTALRRCQPWLMPWQWGLLLLAASPGSCTLSRFRRGRTDGLFFVLVRIQYAI
jgi:hypothetical protein